MTTAAEKTSEPESLIDDAGELVTPDELTFEHAIQLQRNRALGAAFAHRCLTALIWVSTALVLAVGVIGYLSWKVANPPMKYFATEGGRVTKMIPTDKPGHSRIDVSAFGSDTIRQSFTLDFVHFRDQMTQLGERYSEVGYQDYYKALAASNVLKAVKDQRMNLWVEVGPGVIQGSGKIGDNYAWEYQYPVTLKLDGQQTGSPGQRFIFTLRIQQTDVRVKDAGLEVTQVITTNAN